ncbi:MAG: hypothetical protein ACOCP4_02980, partial [Candidatus Woesearchaeota archaeon]
CFDEIKTLYREFSRQPDLGSFFLNAIESTEVDASTAAARSLVNIIKKEQYMEEDKRKYNFDIENSVYRIITFNKKVTDTSTVKFKNNANWVIFGQPIFTNSSDTEKNKQKSFGFAQGFIYRLFFYWDKQMITSKEDKKYREEHEQFFTQLSKQSGETDERIIIDKLQNTLQEVLNNIPYKEFYLSKDVLRHVKDIMENESQEFKQIQDMIDKSFESGITVSEDEHNLNSYIKRLTNEFVPYIASILAFVTGKPYPDYEQWRAAAKAGGISLQNLKEYMDEAIENPVINRNKKANDLSPLILNLLKDIYSRNQELDPNEPDPVQHYPTRKAFIEEFKKYFKVSPKGGEKVNETELNKALNYLQEWGRIKITNVHPHKEDVKFPRNAYKVIAINKITGNIETFRK